MNKIKILFLNLLLKIKNCFSNNHKKSISFVDENTKNVLSESASLEISAKAKELQQEVEKITTKIVEDNLDNIDKTLDYLKSQNISIYRTKFVLQILKYINEKPGFIIPLHGFKALYLNFFINLLCNKKIVFNNVSKEMFIFSTKEIDKYFLASQIYKFVAFRNKMSGFEYESQEKFKKLYKNPSTKYYNKLTAKDIFIIKDVIARDIEASDFALKLYQNENS